MRLYTKLVHRVTIYTDICKLIRHVVPPAAALACFDL